jgi:hypothetical protein
MKQIFLAIAALTLVISGCKKEPTPEPVAEPVPPVTTPATEGYVRVEFYNQVDGEQMVFGKKYLNANGDTFSLKKFVYYISNIQFINNDTAVAENESYHLIDQAVSTRTTFTSKMAPGTYTSMRLMIGVDSTRNCSGVQSGDLDQAKGMFWTWNSGYIFMKLEGSSSSSPQNGSIVFHLGGYSGTNKAQRVLQLNLPQSLVVGNNSSSVIKLAVNINELFKTPNTIDFKTQYYQMTPGPGVKPFADNYQDMISVESVQNK